MRNKQLKLITFAVVLVGAVSLAIYLRQKALTPTVTVHSQADFQSTVQTQTGGTSPLEASTAATGAPAGADQSAAPADPDFQKWLSSEARSLDLPSVDADAKRRELRKIVAKISPLQSRQLLLTAKSPKAPAGEKILSTYLLVESGTRGHSELSELIAAPLVDKGPHPAHSEEEMRGVRDKSLRIMAIDGLFAQAQKDPRAKETLARTIPGIDDPFIRSYAEDKLRQLQ